MKRLFILTVLIYSLLCNSSSADVHIGIESSKVCNINYRLPKSSFTESDTLILKDSRGNYIASIVLDSSGSIFFDNVPFGKYLLEKVGEDKYIPIIMDFSSLDNYHICKLIDFNNSFYSKDDALKLLSNGLDLDSTYEEVSKVIKINKSENSLINKLPITGKDNYGGYFAIVLLSLGFFLVRRKKQS